MSLGYRDGELVAAEPFYVRHRGPFLLCLSRPHKTPQKALRGFWTVEWLRTAVTDGQDALEEARALLEDPRDNIEAVHIHSETEQQFVGAVRKADVVCNKK